jgi:hypothetical protein
MQILAEVRVPFARPLVYATYRDKLSELLPYLPDVRAIKEVQRSPINDDLLIINEWHGGGEIPVPARAILTESMLSWTDRATWHLADYTTEWQIQTHAFTEAVSCLGKNQFIAQGEHTWVVSQGKLTIDANRISGVPSFLAGAIAKVVEDFLGQKIQPNLLQLGEGASLYLKRTQSSPSS